MGNDGAFSKFVNEFGAKEDQEKDGDEDEDRSGERKKVEPDKKAVAGVGIMQAEERNTGAVSGQIYKAYISAGKGEIAMPLLLIALIFSQGSTVMGSYWFVS